MYQSIWNAILTYGLLVPCLATNLLGSPCGFLDEPCRILTPGTIMFLGRLVQTVPYEGPIFHRDFDDFGTYSRFTFEVAEPLYGVTGQKSFSAIGRTHDIRNGLIWLETNQQGLLYLKSFPNCYQASPDFHSKLLQYLRTAKRAAKNGASVQGQISSPLRNLKTPTVRLESKTILETQADEKGSFRFENVPPGTYLARGVAPSYVMDQRAEMVEVAALSCSIRDLHLTMRGTNRISGWIDTQILDPQKYVQISLQTLDGKTVTDQKTSISLNPQPTFSLQGIEPGTYDLVLQPIEPGPLFIFPHEMEQLRIELGTDPMQFLRLPLYPRQKRKFTIRFNDPSGQPLANTEVWNYPCPQSPPGSPRQRQYFRFRPTGKTDAAGQLVLDVLEYTIDKQCWSAGLLASDVATNTKVLTQDTSVSIVLQ